MRKTEDLMFPTQAPGAAIKIGFAEAVVAEEILTTTVAEGEGPLAEVEVVIAGAEEVGNEGATSRLMTLGRAVVGTMLKGESRITTIMRLTEKVTMRHFQL